MNQAALIYSMSSGSPNRRGLSLAEVLVAVTLSVVILSTASTLLQKMFSHQQVSKADARFHIAVSQVAHRFRSDVRACQSCKPLDANSGLELRFADGSTVTYRAENENESTVLRERIDGESTKSKHADEFRFPASCQVGFEQLVEPAGLNGSIAQLHIRLPDPTLTTHSTRAEAAISDDAPKNELVIEAAIGRRPRWKGSDE